VSVDSISNAMTLTVAVYIQPFTNIIYLKPLKTNHFRQKVRIKNENNCFSTYISTKKILSRTTVQL